MGVGGIGGENPELSDFFKSDEICGCVTCNKNM